MYQYWANILIPGNRYTVKYQHTVKYQNTVKSAHFKKQINFASVDYLLVWIILGYKQVKLVSQLHNSKKAIYHIIGGCGKKPVLVIDGNMYNFLMHPGRHHLEQYAELIEAQ